MKRVWKATLTLVPPNLICGQLHRPVFNGSNYFGRPKVSSTIQFNGIGQCRARSDLLYTLLKISPRSRTVWYGLRIIYYVPTIFLWTKCRSYVQMCEFGHLRELSSRISMQADPNRNFPILCIFFFLF